jgi:hypothetical protein
MWRIWWGGGGERFVTDHLLRLWVQIPLGGMEVCHYVLSGGGLCDKLITCPEESYWLWCFHVWSINLVNEEVLAQWGPVAPPPPNLVNGNCFHIYKVNTSGMWGSCFFLSVSLFWRTACFLWLRHRCRITCLRCGLHAFWLCFNEILIG